MMYYNYRVLILQGAGTSILLSDGYICGTALVMCTYSMHCSLGTYFGHYGKIKLLVFEEFTECGFKAG